MQDEVVSRAQVLGVGDGSDMRTERWRFVLCAIS
jgi:hypothetical protein